MICFELGFEARVTKHFPYEAARLTGCFIVVEHGNRPDPCAVWHRELASAAGVHQPDNKEIFELTHDECSKLYVQFWDCRMSIGTGVRVVAPHRVRDVP
jgi:hypothetical protein